MSAEEKAGWVRVRMLGGLHALRSSRGLPAELEVEVPEEGKSALDIAAELDLPLDQIGHLFHQNRIRPLEVKVLPGEHIAFVPPWKSGRGS